MRYRRTQNTCLDLLNDLPDESDSDDEFDGYLEPEDGPVAYRSAAELQASPRSRSLEDLRELEHGFTESPLRGLSPSLSPMQGPDASGSRLAGGSPTQSCTSAGASSSTTIISTVIFII